jgi:endonuclease/exonuclease/phosphatase (EEP) superfamily protein YafD
VARQPLLGPLARRVTELNPGLFRSAFTGQGIAILTRRPVLESHRLVLNPREFRRRYDLPLAERLAWVRERRVCQAVRLDGVLVANLHATKSLKLAQYELVRAAAFVDALARPDEPIVLAGDLNVFAVDLSQWGLRGGGHRVDHVLARGLTVSDVQPWPVERRRRHGVLLSDHAPVDATVA